MHPIKTKHTGKQHESVKLELYQVCFSACEFAE